MRTLIFQSIEPSEEEIEGVPVRTYNVPGEPRVKLIVVNGLKESDYEAMERLAAVLYQRTDAVLVGVPEGCRLEVLEETGSQEFVEDDDLDEAEPTPKAPKAN